MRLFFKVKGNVKMAIGSSVYQPTTVSYEPRPGSLLSQTTAVSPLQVLRKPYVQVILLTLGLLSITFGKYIVASEECFSEANLIENVYDVLCRHYFNS